MFISLHTEVIQFLEHVHMFGDINSRVKSMNANYTVSNLEAFMCFSIHVHINMSGDNIINTPAHL